MMKRTTAALAAILLLFLVLAAGSAASAADIPSAQALLDASTPDALLQLRAQIDPVLRDNGLYPYAELKRGDTGYEVTLLQTQLAALGLYKKKIVDEFGSGTYNALREFEKANGLKVNGIASAEDQQLLYQKSAVQASDTAPALTEPYDTYTPEELYQLWEQINTALRLDGGYPYEVLQKGNVGYEVIQLQTRLKELGYYEKTIVSNFGSGTYSAVRSFQSQNGLKVNGIASVETQQLLYSDTAKAYVKQSRTTTTKTNTNSDATSGATP
ncbi:MAG TPA: peptidoglycan-binding protein [Candidatus Limiplasma sp.]|nr:peptidoglycan-binding protein [Candidatus Limiplasma sp.]HRX09848.1 peptidoglycan-binding protein [Candidatus Limiplasma sp.]